MICSWNWPRLSVATSAPLIDTPVLLVDASTRNVSPPVRVASGMVTKALPQVVVGGSCSTM